MFIRMKLTAIVLTGGKSSRMGRDKALIQLDGKTLLKRAVDFCSSFCDEVLISSDSEDHRLKGFLTVPDQFKNCGPIGGIHTCLQQSSNEWNFVLSVDAPFVAKDFVNFLISDVAGFDAVIPVYDGKKEPLIALYNKRTVPQFENNIKAGEYKLHFLLQELNTHFVDARVWLDQYPKLFQNLNSPEDLI